MCDTNDNSLLYVHTGDVAAKYARHLGTNYIPSPVELSALHTLSCELFTAASSLSTSISALELRLEALRVRRAALEEAKAPYEALASAFRRFPPELMQCVFMQCLPRGRNAVMHKSEAPVVLGRVCRAWRRIVLGTPGLWAGVHVVPPRYVARGSAEEGGAEEEERVRRNEERFRKKKEVVQEWVGRAGACPLSVSFVWFGGEGEEEMRLCGTLLGVLVPLSRRWRVLEFQVPLKVFGEGRTGPFAGVGREDVPLLEAFTLMDNRSGFHETQVGWPEGLAFARDLVSLRKLSLTFFSGEMSLPTVNWGGLRELYLESNVSFFFIDPGHMMATLGECGQLEVCTLKFPLSHPAAVEVYDGLKRVVTLPMLKSLCIDGDQNLLTAFHVTTTLANLRVPRLTLLEIFGRNEPLDHGGAALMQSPEPLVGVRQLLKQSGCPLETLRLESVGLLAEEFVDCLRLAPTIKKLVLRDYGWRSAVSNNARPEAILQALTLSGPSEILSPNLVDFDVALRDASQSVFCDFVRSRAANVPQGVQKLRTVRCTFTAREEEDVLVRIEEMKEAGLDVQATFHLPPPEEISPSAWTGIEGL